MVEATPSPPFKMPEPDLLLEFLIIALDAPAQLGGINQIMEQDVFRQCREPIFGWLILVLRPLDQQPLFHWLPGRSCLDATLTRTRANRDDSHSFVPSRHLMVRHAFVGSPSATSLTETALGASRRPFFGTRPGRVRGAHTRVCD